MKAMKPFSLEEYLKNPNRKIVTRDGRNITNIRINYYCIKPIIAEIEDLGHSYSFFADGTASIEGDDACNDLFFVTEKHEGWINLYKNEDGISWISPNYFTSKKEAEEEGKTRTCSVTTIKIEWEE